MYKLQELEHIKKQNFEYTKWKNSGGHMRQNQ